MFFVSNPPLVSGLTAGGRGLTDCTGSVQVVRPLLFWLAKLSSGSPSPGSHPPDELSKPDFGLETPGSSIRGLAFRHTTQLFTAVAVDDPLPEEPSMVFEVERSFVWLLTH